MSEPEFSAAWRFAAVNFLAGIVCQGAAGTEGPPPDFLRGWAWGCALERSVRGEIPPEKMHLVANALAGELVQLLEQARRQHEREGCPVHPGKQQP